MSVCASTTLDAVITGSFVLELKSMMTMQEKKTDFLDSSFYVLGLRVID